MAGSASLHGGSKARPASAGNRNGTAPHRKRSLSPAPKRPPVHSGGARGPHGAADAARGTKRGHDGHEERPLKKRPDMQGRGGAEDGEIKAGRPPVPPNRPRSPSRYADDRPRSPNRYGGDRRDDRDHHRDDRHGDRDRSRGTSLHDSYWSDSVGHRWSIKSSSRFRS